MIRLGILLLMLLVGGCAIGPGYYWQAAQGQAQLWWQGQPVEEVLATSDDPVLRQQLQRALALRRFASAELGLPANDSYHHYVDLQRPAVVWNLFAAPELASEPLRFCVPVAGCLSYLGYFSEADARAHGDLLKSSGHDIWIGRVPAYSTLGWFDDPLLSTFIHWPESELALLLFHELTHQLIYVADDSDFNESLANAVAEEGLRRWLAAQGLSANDRQLADRHRYRRQFSELVVSFRQRLHQIYQRDLSDDDKRAAKAATIAELQQQYRQLRDGPWQGYAGYDGWFAEINNAMLAAVGVYNSLVPQFQQLLMACDRNLPRFYARVAAIGEKPLAERRQLLAAGQCPP